jgi:hypothetical protein
MTRPGPFNPVDWLSSFRAVGGFCWFPSPDDMHVAWQIAGRSSEDHWEARRLHNCVELSDERERRWREIEALLRAEVKEKIARVLEEQGETVH